MYFAGVHQGAAQGANVLGRTSLVVGPAAGTNSVVLAVTPPTNTWAASANAGWLHLSTANQGGAGNANVVFTYDSNPGGTRIGTLTIGGQTLTIIQAGSSYVQAPGPLTALISSGLNQPYGVAVDSADNVYIADYGHNAVKEWSVTSDTVVTLVSNGLSQPTSVAVDSAGNVYIADSGHNAVKEWMASSNTVIKVMTNGLSDPYDIALDTSTNVYVDNIISNEILEYCIPSNIVVYTLVTNLNLPISLAVDAADNLYIGDDGSGSIKERVAATGSVITVFPAPSWGMSPRGVAVDGGGNLIIADDKNADVEEWTAATGILSTLIPSGLNNPQAVAVDASGDVFVADAGNNTIEELPYAFVNSAPRQEGYGAGSDTLPPPVPATVNLGGPFTPTSSQSWLTITGVSNGVVGFSFTANTATNIRIATITELGQAITVTQAATISSNLYLPVYQVVQAGASYTQATNLANILGIPTNGLVWTNGIVSFIDPTNYMPAPYVQVTNTGSVVRVLNLGALTNMPVYSSNAALNSASSAFASAGLTPPFGTPSINHGVLNAFFTNADGSTTSVQQFLDTRVHYHFSLPAGGNSYSLIGPGAKALLDYGPAGNVTHLHYAASQMIPGPLVQVISPTEASNRLASLLPPNSPLNLGLVYMAPAFVPPHCLTGTVTWTPTNIIPWYVLRASVPQTNGSSGTSISVTETKMIPATDDPNYVPSINLAATFVGSTQIVASVTVSGGTPPYNYLWSGSNPSLSTNTGPSISYTPLARVTPPNMAISFLPSNNSASVSWAYPSAGFILQSTTNLASGSWNLVTNAVQTNTGFNAATVAISNQQFLRLVLAANVVPWTEAVSIIVVDANGVDVTTNQTLTGQAPVIVPGPTYPVNPPGTNRTYGDESPYDVDYFDNDRSSWQNAMRGPGGGTQVFDWRQYNSQPGDFMEPASPGTLEPIVPAPPTGDQLYAEADWPACGVNAANFAVYFGHGGAGGAQFYPCFTFTWPNYPITGDCAYMLYLYNPGVNMDAAYGYVVNGQPVYYQLNLSNSWGNIGPSDYLCWIGFYACEMLQWNINDPNDNSPQQAGNTYAPQVWINAFNGLHLMMGYHSVYWRGPLFDTPGVFADLMLGNSGNGPMTIKDAWFAATEENEPEGFNFFYCFSDIGCTCYTWPAAMGALGPIITVTDPIFHSTITGPMSSGLGEFYPGSMSETVGQTITPSQVRGWWYMNEQ